MVIDAPYCPLGALLLASSVAKRDLLRLCPMKRTTLPLLNHRSELYSKWTPKLDGELARAREAQVKVSTLQQREIEQGVLAVFLHSQPQPHQRAETSELYSLLIHPGMDLAGLEVGLEDWRNRSWFLSEAPNYWRLMTEPNLNKMLHEQVERLDSFTVYQELDR